MAISTACEALVARKIVSLSRYAQHHIRVAHFEKQ
jgi:hypothetical protein